MNSRTIRFVLALIVGLALMAGGARSTYAQGGLTYNTGFQVQNLSDSSSASVTIYFYSQSGGTLLGTTAATINPLSSTTFFPITLPGGATSFNGSLVIESSAPVAAIANLLGNSGAYGASVGGFSSGSTTFNLPLVMCNNSGFNTFFNVQNAGDSSTDVTITYIPGSNGKSGVTETATLAKGAAKTFDQQTGSGTKNCTDLADGSGRFIGSARITTTGQPVVASVMQLNTTTFKIMMGYNGFASGSSTVGVPLVMANNSGFYTGIQIQNVGSSSTTVTVDYSANTAGSFNPADETCNLSAGASCTLIQNGGAWTGKYIGGATVTSNNGQELVAIVNQVSLGGGGVGPFGTAYEGFNPTPATSKISAPLVMSNNSGYYTGIQVQNVGGADCASVTMDYGPNSGGSFNPADEVFSLANGASKTIIQNSTSPGNGSAVNNWGTNRYIGSAAINAPGCKIVAIVNEVKIGAGDSFFTYNAFNH